MLRVVLDTNVFVSSLLVKQGPPAHIIDAWRDRQFLLITSPTLIAEIQATLQYPRIRRKYGVTDDEIDQLVNLLTNDAVVVRRNLTAVAGSIPDDPADEAVLACALEAGADLIVSGDRHLLDLQQFQGVAIISARQFFERLSAEESA